MNNRGTIHFSIPAIPLTQREGEGKALYAGVIKAKDLSTFPEERFKVAYFERNGGHTGYQRRLQDARVDKIKDFILTESSNPLFPSAIVVNSRTPLDFENGKLTIYEPLWIVDGQHRVQAWRDIVNDPALSDEWADYQFPVVVMSGFDEREEMEQFYVFNSRQAKIKTDLVHSLLLEFERNSDTRGLVNPKDKWLTRATVLEEALNQNGIWKGKIGYDTDSDVLKKTRIIQATSFHTAMKPFFVGGKKLFDIETPKMDEWVQFVNDLWTMVATIYPKAAKENPQNYSLMKTVGLNAITILVTKIANNHDLPYGPELIEETRTVLARAARVDFSEAFWLSRVGKITRDRGRWAGAYSSGAGHNRLAMSLLVADLL